MRALSASLRRSEPFELLLILVLGLTPLLWYGDNTIVFGHDTGFSLDPTARFIDRLFTWTGRAALGFDQSDTIGALPIHGLEAVVAQLGFSLTDIQKITFSFWFVAPGLSMYALLHHLNNRNDAWVFRLTGTGLYMFNHFLLQGWFVAERTKFSLVAAMPFVLMMVMLVADRRIGPVKTGLLIGIVVGLLNGGGSVPLYAAMLLTAALAVAFFGLIGFARGETETPLNMVKLSLTAAVSFLLLNAYWLLPLISGVVTSYESRLAGMGGLSSILTWADIISAHASQLNLFRLQGLSFWYADPHPYSGAFFNYRPLIAVSALLPLLAFLPVLRKRSHVDRHYVLFFALLALLGMFFSGGTHSPLGAIYRSLMEHVPGFVVVRSPYLKFAPALWLAYAVLIALTVSTLMDWARVRLKNVVGAQFITFGLGALLVGSVIAYDYPVFSGSFFNWSPQLNLTTMVRVPEYVFEFGQWANSEKKPGRVVLVPPVSDLETYNWGYMSHGLVASYYAPTFANTALVLDSDERALVDEMYVALKAGETDAALDYAATLGARYFLLRRDVLRQPFVHGSYGVLLAEDRPDVYAPILNSSESLSLVGEWGQWSVFEIEESKLFPHVYAERPEWVDRDNVVSLKVGPFFSTGAPPSLVMEKISPTKYLVQIRNAQSPYMLVFGERFSSNWKLYQSEHRRSEITPVEIYLDGRVAAGSESATFLDRQLFETWMSGPLGEDYHVEVNGYANGWYVTNLGSYDLIIEYWPQRLLYLGLAVTTVSTLGSIGYLFLVGVRRLRNVELRLPR